MKVRLAIMGVDEICEIDDDGLIGRLLRGDLSGGEEALGNLERDLNAIPGVKCNTSVTMCNEKEAEDE